MDDHPAPGEIPAESDRDVVLHPGVQPGADVTPAPAPAADYDAPVERAIAVVLQTAEESLQDRKREALALLTESDLEDLPEIPARLRGVPLLEALLERSRALGCGDPRERVRLANWACILADRLETGDLPLRPIRDLRCRAWAEMANAYRLAEDLNQAEAALAWASELFAGSTDEPLLARLLEIQVSVVWDQRRYDEAVSMLDWVHAIYRRRGDRHLAGRTLIRRALCLGYRGRPAEAVRLMTPGLELVDEQRDPRLVRSASHGLARLLLDCGRPRDARMALFNLKARNLDGGGRVGDLEHRWVEARIKAGLGELGRAEAMLLEVKRGFAEAEPGCRAALAALELGSVMLQRGRVEAATAEVLQAVDVFWTVGIPRQAGAALLMLRTGFEMGKADVAILDYVIDLLRKGEIATRCRLEPPLED